MTLIRYTLYLSAIIAGANAVGAWMASELTDAGILGAVSATAVLIAEGIGYCQRRSWDLARRTRAEVWERRDAQTYSLSSPGEMRAWEECDWRWEPCLNHDHGHSGVWPFDVGSPE